MAILDGVGFLAVAGLLAAFRLRRRGRDRRSVDRYHRALRQLERAETRIAPTGDLPRST